MNKLQHAYDSRADGFVIDETCYPWVAYKGHRFAPDEIHQCYTSLESALIRTLVALKDDGAISAHLSD